MFTVYYNKQGLMKRPTFSLLCLVKLLVVITVLNTSLTLISLTQRSLTMDVPRSIRLELSRYPDEEISVNTVRGAKLTILDSRTVFRSKDAAGKNLGISDIFISVRSTNKYHKPRLRILLDTWISVSPANTWIFTDQRDEWLSQYIEENYKSKEKPTTVLTGCPPSTDSKWALTCKMYWEYRTFLLSKMAWFCHFDDDTFVNLLNLSQLLSLHSPDDVIYIGRSPSEKPIEAIAYDTENVDPEILGFNDTTNETDWIMPDVSFRRVAFHYALGSAGYCISRQLALDMKEHTFGSRLAHIASSIAMPDDCIVGYVITHRLNVSLIDTDLMHTHLENLEQIEESTLHKQVTLSYALPTISGTGVAENNSQIAFENVENSLFFGQNSSSLLLPRQTKPNVVKLKGKYSSEEDPTRFRSLYSLFVQDNETMAT